MTFVVGSAALLGALGAISGAGLGLLLRRLPLERRIPLFRIAISLPLVAYALHVYWTYRYSVGWVDLERSDQPVGLYPGVIAFALLSLALGVGVFLAALWIAGRLPVLAALYPAILFVAYFNLALPLVGWQAPFDGVILDNMPNVWLFLIDFAAVAFIATAAALAIPRSAVRPDAEPA